MKNILFVIAAIYISTILLHDREKYLIPIKSERNITLVTVKIGNVEIPDILLDTGMPFDGVMIYNPDYKDSLDLTQAIEVRIAGAGDDKASKALLIDSTEFLLHNLKLKNQRIIMLQGESYKGFPSNGIIGHSIFGNYITHIDYDQNIMTLHSDEGIDPDDSWTALTIYFKGNNIPWLDISVMIKDEAPIPLSTYIDLASGDAIELLEKQKMKFNLPEKMSSSYLGRGLSGDIYGKTGKISKLILGTYELNDVVAAIAPAKTRSKQDAADAILGNDSLRRFNLIFDYKNKKLYIRPNKYFNNPFIQRGP